MRYADALRRRIVLRYADALRIKQNPILFRNTSAYRIFSGPLAHQLGELVQGRQIDLTFHGTGLVMYMHQKTIFECVITT